MKKSAILIVDFFNCNFYAYYFTFFINHDSGHYIAGNVGHKIENSISDIIGNSGFIDWLYPWATGGKD